MELKEGYVVGIEYLFGVHRELAPTALNAVLLMQGREPVALQDGFSYCDLGCGQGDSVNFFAACHPEGEFHGVDFNPGHIAGAKSLSGEAALDNVSFWEASFVDLARLPLPGFDFIVLHGVYSWVAAETRRGLVEFMADKLKPGGVVYLSYNCLPGWSAYAPLRELLYSYADTQSGTLERRIELAIEFVDRLKSARAAVFTASPALGSFFEYLCTLPRNYLAHEFFNRDWAPFYHAELVKDLAAAKLSFSGPANFAENHDIFRFDEEQQRLIDGVTDPVMRESVKDVVVNQLLRRDLFTLDRPSITPSRQERLLLTCRFALIVPERNLERKALLPIGEAVLDRELYDPILSALELEPHSLGELLQRREIGALGLTRVRLALIVLLSADYVMPAVEPTGQCLSTTGKLNAVLLKRESRNNGKSFLASPVLRNAVKVEWLERLLILCEMDGNSEPQSYVRAHMEANHHQLSKDGEMLQSEDEILAELALRIESFRACRLPLLRRLGVF